MSSLAVVLAKSPRPSTWRHVPALKQLVDAIYGSVGEREDWELTEKDWEPARAFLEERKAVDGVLVNEWQGWSDELDRVSL